MARLNVCFGATDLARRNLVRNQLENIFAYGSHMDWFVGRHLASSGRRNLHSWHDSNSDLPFYGQPKIPSEQRSVWNRFAIAAHSATTAFSDPVRGDAVAALGEITGSVSLRRIVEQMQNHPTGRQLLQDRPVISKSTIPYDQLIADAPDDIKGTSKITFGQAYGYFLKIHGFDPDDRAVIRYIEDEESAWAMLRYRQCHDFWHVLAGLPPTVAGELGIKWLELFQTGLPMTALSSTVGALRLDPHERDILFTHYLPWAIRASRCSVPLMNVYYEKEFDTPLEELRESLQLEPAPQVI